MITKRNVGMDCKDQRLIAKHSRMKLCIAQLGFLIWLVAATASGSPDGWFKQSYPDGPALFESVDFANKDTGIVVGLTGELLRTTDGGKFWLRVSDGAPYSPDLHVVQHVDSSYWLTGGSGLFRSNDAGLTWIYILSEPRSFQDFVFTDRKRGVAIDGDNNVIMSLDSGRSWNTIVLETGESLTSIDCIEPGVIVVTTLGGSVAVSTDSGDNWNETDLGISNLWDSKIISDSSIVLAGYDSRFGGVIFLTTNRGGTWETTFQGLGTIRELDFFSPNLGYAVGDGGLVLKTENGGHSWFQQRPPTFATLTGVSVADSISVCAVGLEVVIRTETGGVVGIESEFEEIGVRSGIDVVCTPNPSFDRLKVSIIGLPSNEPTVSLYDISGVLSMYIIPNYTSGFYFEYDLSVANLPSGVYCLEVKSLSKVTRKLISVFH